MQTPSFVGQQLGSFEILSLLGAGGPPPLAVRPWASYGAVSP